MEPLRVHESADPWAGYWWVSGWALLLGAMMVKLWDWTMAFAKGADFDVTVYVPQLAIVWGPFQYCSSDPETLRVRI